MPSKQFIDPKQAQKFQLVHRSQQDPLIASESASKMVFRPLPPSKNLLKNGKWDISQKPILENEIEEATEIKDVDATNYGIFFEDAQEYDYLKHLKPMGQDPSAVFIESTQKPLIPEEAMASSDQMKVGMLNKGETDFNLELDMDPELKEIWNALNDDAYLQNSENEDAMEAFFEAIDSNEIPEQVHEILEIEQETDHLQEREDDQDWMKAYKFYKKSAEPAFSDDGMSIAPTTNYSMSSSAMFRNKNLTLLDDRFESLLSKEYAIEEEEDFIDQIEDDRLESAFNEILDFEINGKRMVAKQDFEQELDQLRRQLVSADINESKEQLFRIVDRQANEPETEIFVPVEKQRDAWDCETIISTFSNIYNRPRLIDSRVQKIKLDKNGFPVIDLKNRPVPTGDHRRPVPTSDHRDEEEEVVNKGQARDKMESKDEKKQRKEAAKQEKREKREQKKQLKEAFKTEKIRQSKIQPTQVLQQKTVSI